MRKFLARLFWSVRYVVPAPQPILRPIDGKDREKIRIWLADPTTQWVLGLMAARCPSVFIAGRSGISVQSKFDLQAASNRLHQIQGWQSYQNILLTLGDEPAAEPLLEETYHVDPHKES